MTEPPVAENTVQDDGAAGVALIAVVGVALVLTVGIGAVATLVAGKSRAQTAADAAALAAAPVTFRPFGAQGDATSEARRFAAANGARLLTCHCDEDPSWAARTVRVVVDIPVAFGPLPTVRVQAESLAEFIPVRLAVPAAVR
ncbi:MAG: pilus assembly protein TadG-related protein [Acidimicrobiia bacterium]